MDIILNPILFQSAILNNRFKVPYWFYIYSVEEKLSFMLERNILGSEYEIIPLYR